MRMADRHLIDRCLNGDSAAFGMLVDRYKESVYALAYSRLRNFHDAEDITQEAFTKAYQKLRTLRQWDEFYSWIYAITFNLCKDWIKARAKRPDREFIEDHPASSFHFSVQSPDEDPTLAVLHEALDSLPESYQHVLTLHYLGDMDCKEMAEFLGKSPSAVWQSLSRARASLKKEILDMMSETYEQNRLRASFTFHIVEIIKRIRIDPVPPRVWPWGFSIASGLMIGILCIGMNANLINTESYTSISSLSGRFLAQEVGEIPVDVVEVPETSVQQSPVGNLIPEMQNALFMAPQAEGDTWTKKADMPTARICFSASAVNGKIYAIGGQILGGARVSTVEEYDPVTDTWAEKTDMPTPRGYLSSSAVDGRIYAIGGYDDNHADLPTVEEYDPVIDKWTKKADMPTPRWNFSTTVVNGKIYAIGGWRTHAGGELSAVEEYDPASDKWTKKAAIPSNRQFHSACAVDGKIYVIGGWRLGDNIPTVEEYDPIKDEWTKRTDMPTTRSRFSAAVVNGRIYAIGGSLYNTQVYFSTVEEYDPVTDTWTKKADMPTARAWLSASAVNGKIYAIGGEFMPNPRVIPLSTVEEYTPEGGEKVDLKGKLPTTWGEVRTASSK